MRSVWLFLNFLIFQVKAVEREVGVLKVILENEGVPAKLEFITCWDSGEIEFLNASIE